MVSTSQVERRLPARAHHNVSQQDMSQDLAELLDGFERTVDHVTTTANHNTFYHRLRVDVPQHNAVRSQLNELSMMRSQVQALQAEFQHATNLLSSVESQMQRVELNFNRAYQDSRQERIFRLSEEPQGFIGSLEDSFRDDMAEEFRLSESAPQPSWIFSESNQERQAARRGSPLRMTELRLLASEDELSDDGEIRDRRSISN